MLKKKVQKFMRISAVAILGSLLLGQTVSAYTPGTLDTSPTLSNLTNVSANLAWVNQTGGQSFICSNTPEALKQEGILYKDDGSDSVNSATITGNFKVYWSHRNDTTGNLSIGMAIFNNTANPIKVYFGKHAHSEGSKSGYLGLIAGQTLLSNWFSSSDTLQEYATVDSNAYTYISFTVSSTYWAMGMYDVTIKDALTDTIHTGAGITVETYATSDVNADPSSVLAAQTMLPITKGVNRGSCGFANRTLNWDNAATNTYISFTSTASSKARWGSISNDTVYGYDMTTQTTRELQGGSYGMILTINVTLQSDSTIVLIPSKNTDQAGYPSFHYPLAQTASGLAIGTYVGDTQCLVVANGTAGQTITLQTSLPSNDESPLRLAVIPQN